MQERFVVGRDREIAQLQLALGSGTDGLRLAMLSGRSGLGKTTLAEVTIDHAAQSGFRTVFVRGRAGSLSTPFAPLVEAIPELSSLLSIIGQNEPNIEQAGIILVQLMTELAEAKPLLLVVDDAHALDESTIAVLPFLSGMAESANLTLFFVEQTDAVGVSDSYRSYVDGLLARRVVSHLRLGPMGDEGIRQIVARELSLESTEDVPDVIVQRAEGNPWFARELANGWSTGRTEVPSNIAAAAMSRLHSLEDVGKDIVSAVAICPEGVHIAWLEEFSGLRPRHFVAAMERVLDTGLVREDGEILTIAHPLMQEAVADDLSAAMRRALHLELVEVIEKSQLDPAVVSRAAAFHLAAAGRTEDAIERYIASAEVNEVLGKLHEARADLVAALALEDRIAQRKDLLRKACAVAAQLGSHDAPDLFRELGRLASGDKDDELYAYALFHSFGTSSGQTEEPLRRAAVLSPEINGWAACSASWAAEREGNLETALQLGMRAVDLARTSDDRELRAFSLMNLASVQNDLGHGELATQSLRDALRDFIQLRLHRRAIMTWSTLVESLVRSNDIANALRESEAADQYVVDLGLDNLRAMTLADRALTLMASGTLELASQLVEQASGLAATYANSSAYSGFHSMYVSTLRALVAYEAGTGADLDLAVAALEAAREHKHLMWVAEAEHCLTRSRARRDGIDAVLPNLASLENDEERYDLPTMSVWLLRQSVLHDAPAGLDRVRELRKNYAEWDFTERSRTIKLEIDATLGALDHGKLTDLDEVAKVWAGVGCALDALRVNAVTGAIALRKGDKETARTYLQSAKDGLATCGASADADLVAALLRQTGARSRAKSRTTSVGPLTKRELEIARLVASGLKNSEVASTLFLAEKTVAAHLSNIYGKVEVRSRVQLGQWIRANDPEFEATLASTG